MDAIAYGLLGERPPASAANTVRLMLALYRSGRQAEALQVYAQVVNAVPLIPEGSHVLGEYPKVAGSILPGPSSADLR